MTARTLLDVLEKASQVQEETLGALSVELANNVLKVALDEESHVERRQKQTLRRLLSSKKSQTLSLALTDRSCRPATSERQVASILEVVRSIGIDQAMPLMDRVQLRALLIFGSTIPRITADAVAARLHREATPFVLDAETEQLSVALSQIHTNGQRVNLNFLGEEILGEAEAIRRANKYLELLAREDVDALSVKLSGVCSQMNLLAPESVTDLVLERLLPALQRAQTNGILVYFDMEAFRDLAMTVTVVEQICARTDLDGLDVGLALQAYLPDTRGYLERLLQAAKERRTRGGAALRLRLVKGANLATEAVEASYHRLTCPIFPSKLEVDANYKRLLRLLLSPQHQGNIQVGLGSHNLFDQCYGLLLSIHRGVRRMLDLEMLTGMAGATGRVLVQVAGGALLYTPTVPLDSFPSAVSYLVRRLDENTGPENFLQTSVTMKPGDAAFDSEATHFRHALQLAEQSCVETLRTQDRALEPRPEPLRMGSDFDNCADTDWTRSNNRAALQDALGRIREERLEISSIVAGQELRSSRVAIGRDPSRPGVAAYRIHLATEGDVSRALQEATAAQESWQKVSAEERADILCRVADELEKARLRLISTMVLDAGKRPLEADIEVSEAVDFARYYAQNYLTHNDEFCLRPRGLTVVTPPFNFPLAIPLGGVLAALVTGNPVILKPAPETPLVAWVAVDCLYRAGIPSRALSLLLCGDDVASPLITDQRVKTVVLTGGTSTARGFLKMRPDLHLLAETGGKNGIYVSALSDRDAAVRLIVESAFGHAGQKCSAASQLVLEREVFEDASFRETLLDAASSLRVGSAWDLQTFVTPLIREPEGALRRILEAKQQDLGSGQFLLPPHASADNPQLVSPGVLWGVQPGSFPHQTEFFGPVLSVLCAKNLKQGLAIMNGTAYGLTAGFVGLSEKEQVRFVTGIDAGNVYVNRGITGAVVGRQPFGGLKESCFGPGAKAGGPQYLLQFCEATARPGAKFGRARSNVDLALSNWFEPRRGTPVLGEENILRMRPSPTVLVIGDGAPPESLAFTRTVAAAVGAEMRELQLSAKASPEECRRLCAEGFVRLRVVGTTPKNLLEIAAQRGWTVATDPVSQDPRLEARWYTREQSISIAYHRYGNVSLRGIHPLLADLPERSQRPI